jgi:hypothetical protein
MRFSTIAERLRESPTMRREPLSSRPLLLLAIMAIAIPPSACGRSDEKVQAQLDQANAAAQRAEAAANRASESARRAADLLARATAPTDQPTSNEPDQAASADQPQDN